MKNISPQIFFLIVATIFGLGYLLITPPFQVPDEFNHFYRAYQISEGKLIAEKKIIGWVEKFLKV